MTGDAPGDELAAALNTLARLLASRHVATRVAEVADVDVSQQGVQILRSLALRGEQPIAGVARDAQMDISAVSRQLKVLEADGLVRRRREPNDARVVLIAATAAGRRVAARITDVLNRHLDDALAAWSPGERRELGQLLGRLVHDLQATEFRPAGRPRRVG